MKRNRSHVLIACGIAWLGACSSPTETSIIPCDPNAPLPDPRCLQQALTDVDAGPDGDGDAGGGGGAGGQSAVAFIPDAQWSNAAACAGECVPQPSDTSAGAWPNEPLLVWFGPKSDMPAACPDEAPIMKWQRFGKLIAPSAQCDACACEAQGTCDGLPASIEIRAGLCGVSNVQTTPFNGPADWTGTCTSENAMSAGTMCNGVPCAQSVSAAALPAPKNEACKPTSEKPTATIPPHEWLEGALACNRKDLDGTCEVSSDHCRPTKPSPWMQCVAREGKYDECPGNYNEVGPRWYYKDNPIDDRGCSECACGAPKDGICTGSFGIYSDSLCVNEFVKMPVASTGPFCADLVPPGPALGSKTISNLSYVPGKCAVAGGVPIGAVIPNDDANSGAVTFCCRNTVQPLPPPH